MPNQIDPLFTVKVLARTANPQTLAYAALHQCYSEDYVGNEFESFEAVDLIHSIHPTLSDTQCGELAVKHLLKGDRGHYSPLEGPQISFAVGYFPHSVMQQATRHRISVAFSVQSMRYSGQRIADLADRLLSMDDSGHPQLDQPWHQWVEDIFYLRPVGEYSDRQGKRYQYTQEERWDDLAYAAKNAIRYGQKIARGYSEEHARGLLAFDFRQHFVVSFNMRSLMHFLDLRSKKDAQIEIQQLCDLMWPHFEDWAPTIAEWYGNNRLGKARLAP
jgi:thymidylate synthase (FAD)